MINDRLVLIGFAALSAVATAGWVRQTPAVAPLPLEADYGVPVTSTAFEQPVQIAASPTRPIQRVYDDRRVYDGRAVSQPRSKAKSAAIIGGSAAAGAAIGAMAGGGKGAAIGAITGGAGGLVYDQVTLTEGRRAISLLRIHTARMARSMMTSPIVTSARPKSVSRSSAEAPQPEQR